MRNDPRSHGLWEQSAPPAPNCPPLTGAQTAEIAIIGAGYTGLSAALHLAEAGRSVIVLEAEEPGFGGSGRNVGLVNAGMWVHPELLPGELGPIYGPRLIEVLGRAPAEVFGLVKRFDMACEATASGTLHCAVGESGLADIRERARQWQALGAPVEVLDAAETRHRLGGGQFSGALLDRRAGTIQPLAYARGLAQAALGAGAQICGQSAVTMVRREANGWHLSTARGTVSAKWLIVATNAYGGAVFPELSEQLVRLPYFNMATPPLPEELRKTVLPGREGCWDTAMVMSSFRMDQAGRLVFGGVGRLGNCDIALHRSWARRAMHRIFPQLSKIGFEHAWFGWIGMTDNHLPRLHFLGPNALSFAGYNGRGIAPGTVFGQALARHILGQTALEDMPLPVLPARAAPLRAARSAFYCAGAAAMHTVSDWV